MEFLRRVYEERKKYFENLDFYLEEVKRIVQKKYPEAKIYVFGSVIEGEYSIGLSDIDVAVVSNFKSRDEKLAVFGTLTKNFFNSPFEFHVFTPEQWEFFRRFCKYREI